MKSVSEQLAKNTVYLTIASILQKIIAFGYFLLIARVMMPEQTGVYFLATSVVIMCSVLTELGLTAVVIRESAKYPEKSVSLLRVALAIKIIFGLIALLAVFILSSILNYGSLVTHLIWFASIVMLVDALSGLYYATLRAQQRLHFEAVGMFVGQIVTSGFGALVLFLNPSLFLLVLALILGSITNLLISGFFVLKQFGLNAFIPDFNKQEIKNLIHTALPFALAGIFTKIYSTVDAIFISKMLGVSALGIFSVAHKFTFAFQFLPIVFVAALYPTMSALAGKFIPELARVFERALWYVIIIVTPIVFGIWIIAEQMIHLTGNEYAQAVPLLRLFIFVLFPIFLDFPIGSLLNAAGRQVTKTKIMGLSMIVALISNATLIPIFGLFGAPIAALLTFSFMFVAELMVIRSIIPTFSYKKLFIMIARVLLCGLMMLAVGIVAKPVVGWILVMPISAAVYVAGLFLTGVVKKSDTTSFKTLWKKSVV